MMTGALIDMDRQVRPSTSSSSRYASRPASEVIRPPSKPATTSPLRRVQTRTASGYPALFILPLRKPGLRVFGVAERLWVAGGGATEPMVSAESTTPGYVWRRCAR
jgi:hypothetical protein